MSMLFILVVTTLLTAVAWLYLRSGSKQPLGPELPGWSGAGLTFKVTKGTFWTEEYIKDMEKYPRLAMLESPLTLRSFFPKRIYFINDPDLVNEVMLSRGYKEFVNHPSQKENRFSKIIDTSESLINLRDDQWKRQRKIITPSFHWATIRPMIETFNEFCHQAIDVISASEGEVIELEQLVHKLTTDTIGSTSFGVRFDSLGPVETPLTSALLDMTIRFQSSKARGLLFLPYADLLPIPAMRGLINGAKFISETARAVVEQRRNDESLRRDDLLQLLIDAKDEEGNPLPEKHIVHNAFLFLLAGEGTTAGTITWAVYEVSKAREVEEKLLQEFEDVLHGEDPSHANVHEMKYLDAVIKETLRRHPATALTNRDCNVDAEVDGHLFPKGTQFLVNIWALQHSPKYWKDPMKFWPERFDEEHKHELVNNAYLPFGAGPRKCIGFRFALAEVKVALVHLLRTFRFEYVSDRENPYPTGAFNPAPEGGMPMRVVRR
mmetsp:Transcript_17628/g.68438  ORF Transcript_17628/g.68438 Transcript_17628/m.68438 type:complete len:492 (+) Transcript_17628:100-1575(+)